MWWLTFFAPLVIALFAIFVACHSPTDNRKSVLAGIRAQRLAHASRLADMLAASLVDDSSQPAACRQAQLQAQLAIFKKLAALSDEDLKKSDKLATMLCPDSTASALHVQTVASLDELRCQVRRLEQFKLAFAGKYRPPREGRLLEDIRVRSPIVLRWPIERRG